ncbi:MAG: hypothetical protein LUQ49_06005, partial [Methanomicrobiales archaeon]|nr:hypothetical protein [Methanomicrobiales archaeon]
AIRVMKESGIDISASRSKYIGDLSGERFDIVVTLCDEAASTPRTLLPPGDGYLHQEFPDPANFRGDEEEILEAYRTLRDRMGSWIREQFGNGGSDAGADLSPRSPPPGLQKT